MHFMHFMALCDCYQVRKKPQSNKNEYFLLISISDYLKAES